MALAKGILEMKNNLADLILSIWLIITIVTFINSIFICKLLLDISDKVDLIYSYMLIYQKCVQLLL